MKKLLASILLIGLITSAQAWDVSGALQGYWKMNDNAASATVIDSSGHGYNGTFSDPSGDPNTSAHSVAGKVGTALTMDDYDDSINMGNVCNEGTGDFSVAYWIFSDESPMGAYIITKVNASYLGYMFNIPNSLKIGINIADNTSSHQYAARSDSTISSGVWNFVVIVLDRSETSAKIYINNVESTVTNSIGSLSDVGDLDTTGNFIMGKFLLNRRVAGDIDNVQMFNRALTVDEVSALWNAGAGTEATSGSSGTTTPERSNILLLE